MTDYMIEVHDTDGEVQYIRHVKINGKIGDFSLTRNALSARVFSGDRAYKYVTKTYGYTGAIFIKVRSLLKKDIAHDVDEMAEL